ncbi:MAG: glycosyltransferase [Lachnospiraceae bacterium]|nr:glycosyltransferase [Lachnospiraceae bacterium]
MGQWNLTNLKKTIYYLKRNGLRATWYAARERMECKGRVPYEYVAPTKRELSEQKRTKLAFGETISILVPAYRTGAVYLRELIDSVLQQTYPHWELILADATEDDSVKQVVESYGDERIHYYHLEENGGISANTNQALEHASGSYIGLLDHDDVLTPDALYQMAARIGILREKGVEAGFLYSDEDKCDGDRSRYYEPHFKEDFNFDLLLSNNYICHFLVMETGLMRAVGFRKEYDGAQDYDLVLRATAKLMESASGEGTGRWAWQRRIVHVPKVLYHWRCHEASTAANPRSKEYAYIAGRRALQDFADRQGWRAVAADLKHLGFYRLEYGTSIFDSRSDLGAVGGRVLAAGQIGGGRYREDGNVYYEGTPKDYSGYLNRAVLQQNAAALDLRCIWVRRECFDLFARTVGVPYVVQEETGRFDASTLPEGADVIALGLALGRALQAEGYELLWDPALTVSL